MTRSQLLLLLLLQLLIALRRGLLYRPCCRLLSLILFSIIARVRRTIIIDGSATERTASEAWRRAPAVTHRNEMIARTVRERHSKSQSLSHSRRVLDEICDEMEEKRFVIR